MTSQIDPLKTASQALLTSLIDSPLLVGDLPNAAQFDRRCLVASTDLVKLNFDQKLGHLYEDALASLFTSSPDIELVEQNLQVQTDKNRTVGELDFLIRQSGGQLVHLELATKFYLALETDNGFEFPGPDSRDNYDRKIERMLSHQLTLTERYRSHLPLTYQDETIVVSQLVYGCLFDHVSQIKQSHPQFSNPKCRRGKWFRHAEITNHFSADDEFYEIPKHLWPVPIELLKDITLEAWQPDAEVTRCKMLFVKGHSTPYFIAPNEYPDQHATAGRKL